MWRSIIYKNFKWRELREQVLDGGILESLVELATEQDPATARAEGNER